MTNNKLKYIFYLVITILFCGCSSSPDIVTSINHCYDSSIDNGECEICLNDCILFFNSTDNNVGFRYFRYRTKCFCVYENNSIHQMKEIWI